MNNNVATHSHNNSTNKRDVWLVAVGWNEWKKVLCTMTVTLFKMQNKKPYMAFPRGRCVGKLDWLELDLGVSRSPTVSLKVAFTDTGHLLLLYNSTHISKWLKNPYFSAGKLSHNWVPVIQLNRFPTKYHTSVQRKHSQNWRELILRETKYTAT